MAIEKWIIGYNIKRSIKKFLCTEWEYGPDWELLCWENKRIYKKKDWIRSYLSWVLERIIHWK